MLKKSSVAFDSLSPKEQKEVLNKTQKLVDKTKNSFEQILVENEKIKIVRDEQISILENGRIRKSRRSSSCCFAATVNKIRYRSVSPTSKKASNYTAESPSSSATINLKSNATNSNIVTVNQLSNRMQLLWYENNIKCCRKLLKYNGHPNKVLLYPEESWARNASSSYLILTPLWWNCTKCKVVEIAGTKRYVTYAKMMDTECGNLCITGSFKKCTDPDFKLILTSKVTVADFKLGYCMTGSLERGSSKLNSFQTTHFAVLRRAEFNAQ